VVKSELRKEIGYSAVFGCFGEENMEGRGGGSKIVVEV
jgi:hypothetical protein